MAKAVEREQPPAQAESTVASQPGWQQRLADAKSVLAPRLAGVKTALAPRPPARASAAPAKGTFFKGSMKTVFGMVFFLLASNVMFSIIGQADVKLHWHLENIHFVPSTTLLLGALNGLTVLWLLGILAIFLVLRRFDIIPRDPFGMANAQATRRTSQPQVTTLRAGPPRTRAERRHAAEAAATTTAKGTAKGNSSSSRNVTARAKGASGSGSQTAVTPTRVTGVPGDHDDAYERARAADRARRRRAARR